MPSWQGKSRGSKFGYNIFVVILKSFGLMPAYWLLRPVTLYYFLFSYTSSKIIFDYFHLRLGYGRLKSLFKIYRNYYLLGQTIIDKVAVMSGIPNKLSFDFDGEENLRKLVAMQRGGLLLSAHIGNWEIAGHLLERLGTKINIVMFDGEDQRLKEYFDRITGKKNAKIIIIKNDLSHIYEISEALKNKELICIHADRFVEGNKTMTSEFLGEKAFFPAGPFVLAATFDVPVSFVFAMKESSLHYHFYASDVKIYGRNRTDAHRQQILHDFSIEMEKKLRGYPEQWYNYYNFWTRNPVPGKMGDEQPQVNPVIPCPAPIQTLIPQRDPMLMIDRFLYSDEKSSRTALQIREGNIFAENGLLTEPGLIENIAQTAAARIGYICMEENKPVPVGYIGSIQNLEIRSLPKLNEEINTEITIKNEIFHVTIITGKVTRNEELLAQCEMKIFISNRQ